LTTTFGHSIWVLVVGPTTNTAAATTQNIAILRRNFDTFIAVCPERRHMTASCCGARRRTLDGSNRAELARFGGIEGFGTVGPFGGR
jgi:hypothetical protein